MPVVFVVSLLLIIVLSSKQHEPLQLRKFCFPRPPPMHLSRPGRRKRLTAFYLLATLCLITPSMAIWPFPPKRFRGNSLIDAGAMGLSGDGRVVAFGDFNGDQQWVFIPM